MNEEIDKLIEEFEARLQEVKDKYEKTEPELGLTENYWYINSVGHVSLKFWGNTSLEHKMYEIGNVFKTKEEAEFEAEKRKVLHELKQLGREFILDHDNWFFYLKGNQEIDCTVYQNIRFLHGSLYFDTEGELWEAINTVGLQRIKKYLFGIEE